MELTEFYIVNIIFGIKRMFIYARFVMICSQSILHTSVQAEDEVPSLR